MCQLAGLYSGKTGHVQYRNAKICRQFECHALHPMSEYASYFYYFCWLVLTKL